MLLLIPVDTFDCKFFEINFKIKFLVSIILNGKPNIENKRTDTCKQF